MQHQGPWGRPETVAAARGPVGFGQAPIKWSVVASSGELCENRDLEVCSDQDATVPTLPSLRRGERCARGKTWLGRVVLAEDATQAGYSIAAVSKLTGISCHALRAWERRYGMPAPFRTPTGHRRYDAEQVRLIHAIASMVESGHSIGAVMADVLAGRLHGAGPEVDLATDPSGPRPVSSTLCWPVGSTRPSSSTTINLRRLIRWNLPRPSSARP